MLAAHLLSLGSASLMVVSQSGCEMSATPAMQAEYENARLKSELETAQKTIEKLSNDVNELRAQLQTARGISDADYSLLILPEKIAIDSLTGGESYDRIPGDDGVTVYVRPIDKDGDTIKCAGDVVIELFDLQQTGSQKLGRYEFAAKDMAGLWHGKLMTSHFTLKCPWQTGPPAHEEITVRATFTEHLTRRALTAQTVCKVRLGRGATSAPAERPTPR